MATNLEVIGDALSDLNVIAETQTPSAEQGAHGLRKLNELMESWTEREIDLGYVGQSSTTDPCPIPAWAKEAVTAALSIAIAPRYGAVVTPELTAKYMESFATVLRKSVLDKLVPIDTSHLPLGAGWVGFRGRILTGE